MLKGSHQILPNNTTKELFDAGLYSLAAAGGNVDDWQTYASWGLIGKTEEALKGLARFECSESRFYSAVVSWIGGDDEAALDGLKSIPTAHAGNLASLIAKTEIEVLSQMPWTRRGAQDFISAIGKDEKFSVRNVSFYEQDTPNRPYANVHEFYEPRRPPDFYICNMVEWHLIPPNLQELSCPILGQTADTDLHIQAVHAWLKLFDELVVTDHTEWETATGLTGLPVSTFPKSFGIPESMSGPLEKSKRPIDVFASGSLLHPYFVEKPPLILDVLRLPNIKPLFIDGFVSDREYADLLNQSKICFTNVRNPGAMPTRGIEALCRGCVVLVQEESVLKLFADEESGVLTYGPDTMGQVVRQVLDHWEHYESAAEIGAAKIRSHFDLARAASQYFRFLTFLAAKPRVRRRMHSTSQLFQKRSILRKGWIPGGPETTKSIRDANLSKWSSSSTSSRSLPEIIDTARELVLGYAEHETRGEERRHRKLLEQALDCYSRGLSQFPDSLVLRFNFIRTSLYFGSREDVKRALILAERTVSRAASSWRIDVREDVFPWDFRERYFNYRAYFDLVVSRYKDGQPVEELLAKLIFASLHHHLARYNGRLHHFERSAHLDPDFPFFRLCYARALINRGSVDDFTAAGDLLTSLFDRSMFFFDAYRLLRQLDRRGLYTPPELDQKTLTAQKAAVHGIFGRTRCAEDFKRRPGDSTSSDAANITIHKRIRHAEAIEVSFVLVDYSAEDSRTRILHVPDAAFSRDRYEVVLIGLGSRLDERAIAKADLALSLGQIGVYNENSAYNVGLLESKGKVVAFLEAGESLAQDQMERLLVALDRLSESAKQRLVIREFDPSWLCCSRDLAVQSGGFDECTVCRRNCSGLDDLTVRLLLNRNRMMRHDKVSDRSPTSFGRVGYWSSRLGFEDPESALCKANPELERARVRLQRTWLPSRASDGLFKRYPALRVFVLEWLKATIGAESYRRLKETVLKTQCRLYPDRNADHLMLTPRIIVSLAASAPHWIFKWLRR